MTLASWPRGTSAGALAFVRVTKACTSLAWCSRTQAERLRTAARAGRTAAQRGEGRQRRSTTWRGCCLANKRSRLELRLPSDGLAVCVCARLAAKQGPGQHGRKQGKCNSAAEVSHANGGKKGGEVQQGRRERHSTCRVAAVLCARERAGIPVACPRRRAPRCHAGAHARLGRSARYASTQARPKVHPFPWLHGVRTSVGLCTTRNRSTAQLCADVGVRNYVRVSARARVHVCVQGMRASTRSARKNRALARQVQGLDLSSTKARTAGDRKWSAARWATRRRVLEGLRRCARSLKRVRAGAGSARSSCPKHRALAPWVRARARCRRRGHGGDTKPMACTR
jgi:hypothetical protein